MAKSVFLDRRSHPPSGTHFVSALVLQSTMKIVKQSMDFPRRRFIDLVQKYVQFTKIQEMKEKVKSLRAEPNLDDDMTKFMHGMEERIARVRSKITVWQRPIP